MATQSTIRRIMATYNDLRAVSRAAQTGDPTYVTRRVGRRVAYRASNRLIMQLFPPHRGKRVR